MKFYFPAALSGAAVFFVVLANSTKMCYTYDNLSRVTARTVKKLSDNSVVSTETFNYDAAGNVTSAPDSSFQYDTNNRLISWGGNAVSYDLDGNMLSNGSLSCTYDSANRLVSAGGHTHTYNAEDVRIRNLCAEEDTTYTYSTNAKLSMLLMKTTNGVVTKYVYGKGLIGEEVSGAFKTYHFDCRGSTIAITDTSGNITDTFAYDTYGKLISRTGTNKVILGYNGRDGVVIDDNGLIYMRARYYSPEMKRFINADVIAGAISNAITLNRFAYANGNPVSFVDPFGLSAERGNYDWHVNIPGWISDAANIIDAIYKKAKYGFSVYKKDAYAIVKAKHAFRYAKNGVSGTRYAFKNADKYINVFKYVDPLTAAKEALKPKGWNLLGYASIALDTGVGIYENIQEGTCNQKIVSDAIVDIGFGIGSMALSAAAGAKIGAIAGSFFPGLGNIIGAVGGAVVGLGVSLVTEVFEEPIKECAGWVADRFVDAGEWIADTAVEAWDATTDFVEDAGEWITETASDAGEWIADTATDVWNATTDFVEDVGESISNGLESVGNFFLDCLVGR